MAVAGPITLPLTEKSNSLTFSKSLGVWSKRSSDQVNIGISKFIEPQWNLIKKNPDVVQNCIKKSLIEHRKLLHCKDPSQKVTPSFNEALYVLMCMYIANSDPNVRRFIDVGNYLQALVKKLTEMDQFLGNFACFEPTRKKYSTTLKKIITLVFEYSNNALMHKTFKKTNLDRAYALLFSVVPKTLENIKSIVETICSAMIGDDVKVTQEEIDRQTIEGSIIIDHYFWFVDDEDLLRENDRLRELLDEKTKGFDEQAKTILKLQKLLDEQAKENKNLLLELSGKTTDGMCNNATNNDEKAEIPEDGLDRLLPESRKKTEQDGEFEKKAKENIKLQQKLDEQTEEIKNLRFASGECKDNEGKFTHAQNNDNTEQEDELDRLLRESRQRAEQDGDMKLERNYSTTSNFAYGVFDSRGGNLSIKDADVELFIPAGAISTTQEIYIYIDPKARLLNPDQGDPPQSGIEQRETRVAPIVHCGPPGTKFLSHVVLTIPHNAENEDNWQFTPVRSEGDRHYWQNIGTDCNDNADDDSIVIVNGGFCVFMVKHFTSFTLMKDSPNYR
ncbi:uncharacterized protein [Antedon mediterranea]|uniref:uncharacterized protein isoform X2 n=1 Tax=Antedon mediterranea TaxID=105859 RepID=UPI003AF5CCA2